MSALDLVIERLTGAGCDPRRNGQGWDARCPAHDDRRPSLSVTQGTKAVLLKCHADCQTEAVLEALGLRFADLRDQPADRSGPRIVATYDYTNVSGKLLFQVVRRDDKSFLQRRPDPQRPGEWIWNVKGIRRVLYRLPQLRAAIAAGRRIFVVEGERDVEALVAAGEIATTNPGGAGKWSATYNGMLAGAGDVIVVADRDEPGWAHAARVAEHLATVGIAARIVQARTGKDAADHLGAGHGLEDFVPLEDRPIALDNVRAVPDVDSIGTLRDGFRPTDGGNADRLVALHGEHLRHIAVWRKWVTWDGARWVIDFGDRRVLGLARDVVRHLFSLIAEAEDNDERLALFSVAMRTEGARALRSLVDVAASAPLVGLDHEQLDGDPWLLNTPNGTLDLRTDELHEHRPPDLLTMLTGVPYEEGHAPIFTDFLERILPSFDLRVYVQSRLGAALCGEIRQHELNLAVGGGANGKTTLFSIVGGVMGDYAVVAPKSLLIASRHEHHPTDRTVLFRRRLAYAGEIPEGAHLDEAMVKELTGGDRITARRMREDFWSFDPTHKLWLFANHLPHVAGVDHAIWRRLRVIPFDVTIPEDEQDPELARLIVEREGPQVLAWLVEGCRLWQEGIPPPDTVLSATTSYRHGEDTAARFIDEELFFEQREELLAEDLWRTHDQWCAEHGLRPHETRRDVPRIAAELVERDCTKTRPRLDGKRVTIWSGVSLAKGGQGSAA